jgi:hypothetical protein
MDWFIHQMQIGLLIVGLSLGVILFSTVRFVKKDPVNALKMGSFLRQLFKK